jgi:hypothetical protein
MVGGTGVCNKKACMGMMGVGESLDRVGWWVVEERQDVFRRADGSNTFRVNRHVRRTCAAGDGMWI